MRMAPPALLRCCPGGGGGGGGDGGWRQKNKRSFRAGSAPLTSAKCGVVASVCTRTAAIELYHSALSGSDPFRAASKSAFHRGASFPGEYRALSAPSNCQKPVALAVRGVRRSSMGSRFLKRSCSAVRLTAGRQKGGRQKER